MGKRSKTKVNKRKNINSMTPEKKIKDKFLWCLCTLPQDNMTNEYESINRVLYEIVKKNNELSWEKILELSNQYYIGNMPEITLQRLKNHVISTDTYTVNGHLSKSNLKIRTKNQKFYLIDLETKDEFEIP